MNQLKRKQNKLESILKNIGSMTVAFSGGVDSTFLLAVAKKVIQSNGRLLAVTAVSPLHPQDETKRAALFARENHIDHIMVKTCETASDAFLKNAPDRCYVCKRIILQQIIKLSREYGLAAICHGINTDDANDYRPGIRAAEEMNVRAPLRDAGLTKSDIRHLSKHMKLPTWDQPSSGCLATRIPYGEPVTLQKLKMVETAENELKDFGFAFCRVRHYGETAKIEVPPEDIENLIKPSIRRSIVEALQKIGFLYVTIDLEGYASGRLNRSVG